MAASPQPKRQSPAPAAPVQAGQQAQPAPTPVEVRVVPAPSDAKGESFGRKLVANGFIALLTGAIAFATAGYTSQGQQSIAQCQMAKDILLDDQLNPILTDQQKRQVVSKAVTEYGNCADD